MSSDPSQTTSQIESELVSEVNQELERRGTSVIRRNPEPGYNFLSSLVVTGILACLGVLAGTGAMMAMVYTPTVEDANASTAWFQSGDFGAVTRGAHYHGANLLVLLGGAYLAYMLWRGLFRRPDHWRWWRGAALLALAIAFGLSGMLLPYDQLALHGTNIRLGYLAQTPVVGEQLRELAQGGDTIGNATLSRFFGIHVIVLPALTLILMRWLWKDGKTEGALMAQAGVGVFVMLALLCAGFLMPAPLGLQGNLSETFPDARPEWYALPLYELLKLAPSGVLSLSALFVPPLLAVLVIGGLPFVETASNKPARLLKPLRIALLVTLVAGAALAALPLFEDSADSAGYFKKHDIEDVMTDMGKRNDRLLNSNETLPHNTHNLALDLELLHRRLTGNYPEEITEAQKTDWDQWASDGANLTRAILLAPDAETQSKARANLRENCKTCHDQHDEDVELNPAPHFAETDQTARREPLGRTANTPAPAFFFDQHKLKGRAPSRFTRTTSTTRMMDQLKYRLRDILIHAEIRDGQARWEREQNITDLLALCDIVEKLWERNEAEYPDQAQWQSWINEMRAHVKELAKTKDAGKVVNDLRQIGKVCETCHDKALEPLEPVEWRFSRMLTD